MHFFKSIAAAIQPINSDDIIIGTERLSYNKIAKEEQGGYEGRLVDSERRGDSLDFNV